MSEVDTAASSVITDHEFDAPRWWERCSTCGYSMAAHERMSDRARLERASQLGALDHRCPSCVQLDRDVVDSSGVTHRVHTECPHRWEEG
jgi:hypothetical protein